MLLLLYILGGGAAALTWLCILSIYVTKENLDISERKLGLKFKQLSYDRESAISSGVYMQLMLAKMGLVEKAKPRQDLPKEIKDLISSSPDHDEIQEIDGDDELIGVVFDGSYPPEFSDYDLD